MTRIEEAYNKPGNFERPSSLGEDVAFSTKWGVGFVDATDQNSEQIILVEYVDENSPFAYLIDESIKDKEVKLSTEVGFEVENLGYVTKTGSSMIAGNIMSQSAEEVASALDNSAQSIKTIYYQDSRWRYSRFYYLNILFNYYIFIDCIAIRNCFCNLSS